MCVHAGTIEYINAREIGTACTIGPGDSLFRALLSDLDVSLRQRLGADFARVREHFAFAPGESSAPERTRVAGFTGTIRTVNHSELRSEPDFLRFWKRVDVLQVEESLDYVS